MLDCLYEVLQDYAVGLLSVDANQLVRVFSVDQLLESPVFEELLFDLWVLVVVLVDEPVEDAIILDVLVEHVVVSVSLRVVSPLLKLFIDEVVAHLQGHEE